MSVRTCALHTLSHLTLILVVQTTPAVVITEALAARNIDPIIYGSVIAFVVVILSLTVVCIVVFRNKCKAQRKKDRIMINERFGKSSNLPIYLPESQKSDDDDDLIERSSDRDSIDDMEMDYLQFASLEEQHAERMQTRK